MKAKAESLNRLAFRDRNKEARKGEGDRVILNMKPKHLYTGKRSIGTMLRFDVFFFFLEEGNDVGVEGVLSLSWDCVVLRFVVHFVWLFVLDV